jgi:YihY family inner membrane protein
MSLLSYLEFAPELGERIFIAEGAKVIGRATLADDVNVWFNTVIRADVNEIKIGKNTNVQDMCMFHVTEHNNVVIGENTSFGHNVVLHGCTIGNGCLIGMGSIILDGAVIGDNSLVAAGSLITPGKKFPPGSFIKGRPAKADRELTPEELHSVSNHYKSYIGYKDQYLGMESGKFDDGFLPDLKVFFKRVGRHNLFLLSSSLSYYAALGLAPLLLIILAIAALIGEDVQLKIINQVSFLAPEASNMLQVIFKNLKSHVDLGSISGIFGLGFLLFLASFVFMQMRYSLDVIYGTYELLKPKNLFQVLKEKVILMLVVVAMCALFGTSLLINPIFDYLFSTQFQSAEWRKFIQVFVSFSILFILFTGLYFFTPTKKKKFRDCAQMSLVTTFAFILGNSLTSLYMKNVALDSLYGAAGALLIFLLWSFYSSLIVLLSVELFEFLKRKQPPLIHS